MTPKLRELENYLQDAPGQATFDITYSIGPIKQYSCHIIGNICAPICYYEVQHIIYVYFQYVDSDKRITLNL